MLFTAFAQGLSPRGLGDWGILYEEATPDTCWGLRFSSRPLFVTLDLGVGDPSLWSSSGHGTGVIGILGNIGLPPSAALPHAASAVRGNIVDCEPRVVVLVSIGFNLFLLDLRSSNCGPWSWGVESSTFLES